MSKKVRFNQKVPVVHNQKYAFVDRVDHLAQGTIISSSCDYNGLVLEYHLSRLSNESKSAIELLIFFRMINFQNDYVIGLNLSPSPKYLSQLVYHNNGKNGTDIINRVPKQRGEKIILLDGCRDFLTPDQFSALKVIFHGDPELEGNFDLKNLDLWIHTKSDSKQVSDESEDLKIPDLINYRSPRLGLGINEVYLDFPKQQWWKKPCSPNLVDVPNKPKIEWNDQDHLIDFFNPVKEIKNDALVESIAHNLKMMELEPKLTYNYQEMGYQLSLHNPGTETTISVASQNQVYLLYVPAESNFEHFIETFGPIQIYSGRCENLLTECIKQFFCVQYVENQNGLWMIFHNELKCQADSHVEIYYNQSLINTQIMKIRESQEKFFIPFDDHGEYFFKVFLNHRLISQYQLSRVQPSATLTAISDNMVSYQPAINRDHEEETKLEKKAKKIINFVKKKQEEKIEELLVEEKEEEEEEVIEEKEIEEVEVVEKEDEEEEVIKEKEAEEEEKEVIEEKEVEEEEEEVAEVVEKKEEEEVVEEKEEVVEKEEEVVEKEEEVVEKEVEEEKPKKKIMFKKKIVKKPEEDKPEELELEPIENLLNPHKRKKISVAIKKKEGPKLKLDFKRRLVL